MHVTLIENHNSSSRYFEGLDGLRAILSSCEDIDRALDMPLTHELMSRFSNDILGYSGPSSISRIIPLYHCLPPRVKLSLYTYNKLRGPVFSHKMSRFLCGTKNQCLVVLFAKYANWPEITEQQERARLYSSLPWLSSKQGPAPEIVKSFCATYRITVSAFKKLPLDLLFGSPNFRKRKPGELFLLDAVNCAAELDYDLVSLNRPPLNTLLEDWKKQYETSN